MENAVKALLIAAGMFIAVLLISLIAIFYNNVTGYYASQHENKQLEQVAKDIKGVDKTFAVQAGRELRVIVKPEEIDDLTSYKVAREIKEKIENEMQYPGTIKITVIRETRAQEEAR